MSYNHGKEEQKWLLWKEAEERIMRQSGIDEETIEEIRTYDRAEFNSDRRYYQKLQEVGTYLDEVAESEWQTEINTVEDLLNEIDNMDLFQVLQSADKRTLQIVLLKMQGYKTDEIAGIVHLSAKSIYRRMDTLRKKLKQFYL